MADDDNEIRPASLADCKRIIRRRLRKREEQERKGTGEEQQPTPQKPPPAEPVSSPGPVMPSGKA